MDEKHPLAPVDPNGVNKAAGEGFHLVYGRVYGLRTSVLRLTNTYGPRMRVKDDRQTFLGTWLRLAVEGEELLVFGDGTQQRDFTYVDDAVEAFLLAGSRDEADGEIFNVGGPEPPISLRDLAELVGPRTGSSRSPRSASRSTSATTTPTIGSFASGSAGSRRSACARGSRGRSTYYREHRESYW